MGIYIIKRGSSPETHHPVCLIDDKIVLPFIGHLPIATPSEANINGFLTTKPVLVTRYWNIAQESVISETTFSAYLYSSGGLWSQSCLFLPAKSKPETGKKKPQTASKQHLEISILNISWRAGRKLSKAHGGCLFKSHLGPFIPPELLDVIHLIHSYCLFLTPKCLTFINWTTLNDVI